jgi:hypothetical protein
MATELEQWAARRTAEAAGESWPVARVVVVDGRMLGDAEAEAAVEDGRATRCGQCSSPSQDVFHDRQER